MIVILKIVIARDTTSLEAKSFADGAYLSIKRTTARIIKIIILKIKFIFKIFVFTKNS